jgi:quercetin dioxygenase-like cupin family protein
MTDTVAKVDVPVLGARDAPPADTSSHAALFAREGFIGPRPLLTPAQCALIVNHCRFGAPPAPLDWDKARAATDRLLYDVATAPHLLALLRPLLGEDIVLWGVSTIERVPGQIHPWHVDIESSAPNGRTASIWIGLENVAQSGLVFISRSHAFGATIQQAQHGHGRRRGEVDDDMALAWAGEFDRDARLHQPGMTEGDAIVYDGRLWHSTHNRGPLQRTALLLQYAAADQPMRMPDFGTGEWPFRFTERKLPCLVVSGVADDQLNWLVPAPALGPSGPVTLTAQPLTLPLELGGDPHRSFPLLDGPTSSLGRMESHASVLVAGRDAHPPHVHDEEELLICLDGEAELVIADLHENEPPRLDRLKPGDFVYYPAYQRHTIRSGGSGPVSYLMFKWQSPPVVTAEPLATGIWRGAIDGSGAGAGAPAFHAKLLFEQPTAYLDKLHAHVTDLQPGGGYEPHADEHDVAIVVLKGRIETIGRTVGPFGVIYYAAGEPHGMRNAGDEPARYLVFEFHAPRTDAPPIAAAPDASEPPPAEPVRAANTPVTARPHPLHAFNDWFWSDRRPRTYIIEYSRLLYRALRQWLSR